jgi:hypothetical protein
MTTKTITWVAPEVNPYESNGKTTYYINVTFDDDSSGSLGKQNQGKAQELHAMLAAFTGTPTEFGLEDQGKKNGKGQPKWKIKSFPGYEPAPYDPGGGGGKSWYNSEEGVRFTQERTDRRTALMQAAALQSVLAAGETVTDAADTFYTWLRKTSGEAGDRPSHTGTSGPTTVQAESVRSASDSEHVQPTQDVGGPTSEQGGKPSAQDTEPDPVPGSAAAGAPCSHINASGDKPDGNPLPGGRVRCLACGQISDREGNFK